MSNEHVISGSSKRLSSGEAKLNLEITGDMYTNLEKLVPKMRNANSIGEAIEVALELLIISEDRQIQLVKDGRIVSRYDLWK